MEAMTVSLSGVLVASLTVNWCCCQGYVWLTISRFFGWITRKLRGRESKPDYNEEKTLLVINIVTDVVYTQFLGWLALIMLLTYAIHNPFRELPKLASTFVFYLFTIHIGKHAYLAFAELCVRTYLTKALHHLIQVGSFVAFLSPGCNSFLGLMGMACEISDVSLSIRRLFKEYQVVPHRTCHRVNAFAGFFLMVVFRGVVPVASLCFALMSGSPLRMTNFDIVVFFFYLTFTLSENVWYVLFSFLKLQETLLIHKLYRLTSTKIHSNPSSLDYERGNEPSLVTPEPSDRVSLYKQLCVTLKDSFAFFLKRDQQLLKPTPPSSQTMTLSSNSSTTPVSVPLTDILVLCEENSNTCTTKPVS